jgi:MFS family permease
MLSDESFMSMMSNYDDKYVEKFISIFYAGEMLGALLSFVFLENFGRRNSLLYSSLACSVVVLWSAMTSSAANLLSARLFTGMLLGVALATAPIYIAEVHNYERQLFDIIYVSNFWFVR